MANIPAFLACRTNDNYAPWARRGRRDRPKGHRGRFRWSASLLVDLGSARRGPSPTQWPANTRYHAMTSARSTTGYRPYDVDFRKSRTSGDYQARRRGFQSKVDTQVQEAVPPVASGPPAWPT